MPLFALQEPVSRGRAVPPRTADARASRSAGPGALQFRLATHVDRDPHEREAERMATWVMRSPAPGAAAGRCACGGNVGADGLCDRCRQRVQRAVAAGTNTGP
ncbi:MAG TPA: hypothetical protein VGO40_10075, partial [Longimicrobium sp.]|nr:hypothetical protein [Longimicrobium sp.]